MAVVGMKRLTFVGLSEDRDDIFSRLMDLGVVEISSQNSRTVFSPETDNNTPDSQEDSFSAAPQVRELEHKMFFLISLIERLSQYDERKKPLFKARRHISKSEMARVARRSGSLTEFAKGVSALDGRIQAVQNDMNRLKNSCNDMALWQDYPYDLSWKGTVHTGLLLLTASPGEYEAFRGALTEAALAAQLVEIKREETRVQGVVFYHRDCEGDLLSLLSRFSVNRADLSGYQGTAVQCRAAMEAELEEKAQELSCLEDRLAQAAKKLPELEVLHDYYAIEKEKLQASSNILQTRSTFLFEGWIPAKFEKLIRRFFSKRYLCSIDIREAREEEQPPTALANGRLGSSIEGVVLMYSAPSYDEADPSWISALFYIIFFGLMLTKDGPKVLEYNARFGDPEAQVVLPRMKNDIVEVMEACIDGTLDQIDLQFEDNAAVCVVLASEGYPVKYEKEIPMYGFENFKDKEGYYCFHAGTKFKDGQIVTNGGRVVGITATGSNLKEARKNAYAATEWITFANKYMRHDIGKAIDEA